MKTKKGYKIVNQHLHQYQSLLGGNTSSLVEYKIGEFVRRRPKCGPLAVFKSKHDVREFMRNFGWLSSPVFKVEYEPSKQKQLWKVLSYGNKSYYDNLPTGTALANAVKLIKEVKV